MPIRSDPQKLVKILSCNKNLLDGICDDIKGVMSCCHENQMAPFEPSNRRISCTGSIEQISLALKIWTSNIKSICESDFLPLSKQISISFRSFPCRTALKSPSRIGKKTTYSADCSALSSPRWEPSRASTIRNCVSNGISWPQLPILWVIHHNLNRNKHIKRIPLQVESAPFELQNYANRLCVKWTGIHQYYQQKLKHNVTPDCMLCLKCGQNLVVIHARFRSTRNRRRNAAHDDDVRTSNG